jgi:hypothetical protein
MISTYQAIDKKLFWFCGVTNDGSPNLLLGITMLAVNFYIWECKLRKTRLSLARLMMDIDDTLENSFALSRRMRRCCKNLNFPLFRKWEARYAAENERAGRDGEEEEV